MEILLEKAAESDYLRIGEADLEGNLYLSDSGGINKQIVDISKREYYQNHLKEKDVMPPKILV
ncbi:hypothetical protein KHA80_05955 [Anaerobacillus sp. HL2]|nr:hypothetical protein KHA80_05955 [Anaerobacillus sp. HL2]